MKKQIKDAPKSGQKAKPETPAKIEEVKASVPAKPPSPSRSVNEIAALAYAELATERGGEADGFPPWQQLLETTRANYVTAAAAAMAGKAKTNFEKYVQAIAHKS